MFASVARGHPEFSQDWERHPGQVQAGPHEALRSVSTPRRLHTSRASAPERLAPGKFLCAVVLGTVASQVASFWTAPFDQRLTHLKQPESGMLRLLTP